MSGFIMNSMARAVPNKAGAFRHTFGGVPTHSGIVPEGYLQPLHLLYTFDTNDPLFPIRLSSARYLPLFYGFPYNAGAVGYRVVSDREIEILYVETEEVVEDFPYDNYPASFPETPISLLPISEAEHQILVEYLEWEDQLKLPQDFSEAGYKFLHESHYPFTQIGGIQRMWQGIPDAVCPNRKCKNHKISSALDVLAVVWNQPVPGVYLWDNDPEYRDSDDVQTIFQICPCCQAIYACNRCT